MKIVRFNLAIGKTETEKAFPHGISDICNVISVDAVYKSSVWYPFPYVDDGRFTSVAYIDNTNIYFNNKNIDWNNWTNVFIKYTKNNY